MTKKILVLDGHSDADTFCGALAQSYADGARESGHDVRVIHLNELEFDPVLHGGLASTQDFEQDLARVQGDLKWCEHVTLIHPLWWGAMPAKLKGLFDRVLLPGYAFTYGPEDILPVPLLDGREARVMVTSDTPDEYMYGPYKGAWFEVLSNQVLSLCGIIPKAMQNIAPVHSSTHEQRQAWLDEARAFGAAGA